MKNNRHGLVLGVKEHLLAGNPVTRLEAILLFGVPDLPKVICDLRKEGWIVKSQGIPYVAAVKRVNKYATLKPPKNLPVREIELTEYWMSR